jgi:N-hydroxyarylamine O-acetyltransferase
MHFDLDAYLGRIAHAGARTPTVATLKRVQRAHVEAIPFENLDAYRGIVPSLDLDDLTAKLVHGERGGYCYEHNTLFAAALTALGFRVTLMAARVQTGLAPSAPIRPRTHMLMLAETLDDPRPHVADVGFGSRGALLEAAPLAEGEIRDGSRRHRLSIEPDPGPLDLWLLESYTDEVWEREYVFNVDPQYPVDIGVLNFNTALNPASPFRRRLFAQRTFPDRHLSLDTRTVVETLVDGTRTTVELKDDDEVRAVLARDFGIVAPLDVFGA